METLSFLMFWKPISLNMKENFSFSGNYDAIDVPSGGVCSVGELEEGDDSFFELELTVSDFDKKKNSDNNKECNRFDSNDKQQLGHYSTKNAGQRELMLSQQQQTTISSMTSCDALSKRKILPIEPSSKPQSPIALLKSAPKLRVSILKKSESPATVKAEKTEEAETSKRGNKLFPVKFKVEEVSSRSMFSRVSSLRKTQFRDSADESASSLSSSSSSSDYSSKHFSKDFIQKYLKLIKPLYVKMSRKNDKMRFSGELSEASPASSPAALPVQSLKKEKQGSMSSGFKVLSRHLVKSRSASGAVSALSPARRDDSLQLQHDGIQSAILHCKNSFSSRDSSFLSRSTSSSSQEIYNSSLLSRFSSDSSASDFTSARKSNEEGI